MRTATFIYYFFSFFFSFFTLFAEVHAMPEPVQAGSILARDADTVPAAEGLGGVIARGDKDHEHHYCWNRQGWERCGKWNECCKKGQTCCGGKRCCDKGYKCHRKHKDDDDHHKRGDEDHRHDYEWVCKKKDDHHW